MTSITGKCAMVSVFDMAFRPEKHVVAKIVDRIARSIRSVGGAGGGEELTGAN